MFSVMSRAAPDKPTEEEEDRSSDEEEEKYGLPHSSSSPTMLDYSYPEPLEPGTSQSGLASLSGFELQTSGLRTRGPGRPRIHVSCTLEVCSLFIWISRLLCSQV